jgi:hypothetical protein
LSQHCDFLVDIPPARADADFTVFITAGLIAGREPSRNVEELSAFTKGEMMPAKVQSIPTDSRTPEQGALRLFFVDEKTGNPVAGVVVSILRDSPVTGSPSTTNQSQQETARAGNQSQLLATLQTDQAGYVSFKFDPSIAATTPRLTVTHAGSAAAPLVVNVADLLAGNDTYTVQIDASAPAAVTPHLGLPSIQLPDIKDRTISPGSVGVIPRLLPGHGLCGQLTPTTLGVRRFGAFLIKADICNPVTVTCTGKVQMVRGKMLEYEITWYPLGTALGDLLNTITLAPCEQVNVAIADWMRRETASQTQAMDIQQQSFQEMNHDRLIVETMQSSVNSEGSSWGVGGSLSLSVPIKKLNLTAAFGGGYAHSSSSQNVAVNTTNQLSEHITQAASFVASQRSTVVFQATASEQQTYQTRTVRNNNHCHTLTFMYYQINRNYDVVTDYLGERDVVLIKCDNAAFDATRAYCNAELLKAALLDQILLPCFDELADALFCCNLKPIVSPPPAGEKLLMDSLTITVKPKEVTGSPDQIDILLYSATGQQPIAYTGMANLNPVWQTGGVHTQTLKLYPAAIDPAEVASMWISVVKLGGPPTNVLLNDIKVTYHVVGNGDFILYSSQTLTTMNHDLRTPVQPMLPGQQPPVVSGKNECVEKSCCIQKLLGHLNCHKRYYNSILWLNEDPNERVMRWSCCVIDESFNLIAQIENDPIALYGDFLVFPAAGSQLVDNPAVLPVSKLVTMPTPGVFAEGILGQCDTCEKIDPGRFWNWKDSPCPDNAPSISPPPTPQAGVKPSDLKADAISNLITFSNVPGAPDSVMKDLISALVSKADSGSSEAKGLLDNLLQKLLEKNK